MKKIEWVKWRDPLKSEPNENFEIQSFKDSYEANDFEKEDDHNKHIRVISGPYGVMPLAEHGLSSSQYKLWVMHTNFNVTASILDKINRCEGVEILKVWTRYRCWIGFGNLFDVEKIQAKIEVALGANKSAKANQNIVIEKLSKTLSRKHKCWVIFNSEHGKIDFIAADSKSTLYENMSQDPRKIEENIIAKSWE